MLISRSWNKWLIFRTQKTEGRCDPKKNFLTFFMLRRFESVFQSENHFFFEKKFFEIFEIFGLFDRKHQSGARPVLITVHRKILRDIFIYNFEKFKSISLLVFS